MVVTGAGPRLGWLVRLTGRDRGDVFIPGEDWTDCGSAQHIHIFVCPRSARVNLFLSHPETKIVHDQGGRETSAAFARFVYERERILFLRHVQRENSQELLPQVPTRDILGQ